VPGSTVVALFGPTGVGKTAVAVALADSLRRDGEDPVAVSADALQVYAGLPILTGAATAEQQERLEHRLLGFLPLDRTFSAGEYAHLAHAEIDGLLAQNRRPIVVGGTGLYLRAALAELDLRPPVPPQTRARRRADLENRGSEALHAELAARAPDAARQVDPADTQRLLRALELLDHGHPPPAARSQLWTSDTRRPTLLVALTMEREALDAAIDARVDAMVAAGAAREVEEAAATASPTARRALGFDQLLDGDVAGMKQATRRYAKRQLTWLRKLPDVLRLDVTNRAPADTARAIHARLRA